MTAEDTRRRRRLSIEERRQRFRLIADAIAGGASTAAALGRYGLSWQRLYRWCEADPEIERAWHACRRFRAHVHAEEVLAVSDEAVSTFPEATRQKTRVTARQWAAARAAPDFYAERLDVHQTGASVHHHVIHLPDRGPRPVVVVDPATAAAMVSGQVPEIAGEYRPTGDSMAALPPATGSPNRPLPSGEGPSVRSDVRTAPAAAPSGHIPARLRASQDPTP